MKNKPITLVLIAFVIISFFFVILKDKDKDVSAEQPADQVTQAETDTSTVMDPVDSDQVIETIADSSADAVADASAIPAGIQQDVVKLYYFHVDKRCVSCLRMEGWLDELVEFYFEDEFKSGKLTWDIVNTDTPKNQHFITDYPGAARSAVLAKYEDGIQTDWVNLHRIWELNNKEDTFKRYVKSEISKFLGED